MSSKRKLARNNSLFIRLNDQELKVLEAAVKIKYGEVQGMKSLFCRQALMAVSKKVIQDEADKRRGE